VDQQLTGSPVDVIERDRRGARTIKRVRIDGCWCRTLDLEQRLGTERDFKERAASIIGKLAKMPGSHGDHGRLRREGRTARPGQANTALATRSRRTRVNRFVQLNTPIGRPGDPD
jgi:hypothetical protein